MVEVDAGTIFCPMNVVTSNSEFGKMNAGDWFYPFFGAKSSDNFVQGLDCVFFSGT